MSEDNQQNQENLETQPKPSITEKAVEAVSNVHLAEKYDVKRVNTIDKAFFLLPVVILFFALLFHSRNVYQFITFAVVFVASAYWDYKLFKQSLRK